MEQTPLMDSIDEVEQAHSRLRETTTELADAVQQAKDEGATWEQLGRALGITRQAAQQRFG